MKSFKIFLNEAGRLFRFDPTPIIPKAQTYAFSPDNTGSGNINHWPDYPTDWKQETGLFAGKYHHVLGYAVPEEARQFLITGKRTKTEKPVIYFDQKHKKAIEDHRPILSTYNVRQGFVSTQPNSGEYFAASKTAPQPISQTVITNPLEHISKHYDVRFVSDLYDVKRGLDRKKIHYNFEGNFEK